MVTFAPSLTEMVLAFGCGARLVGVSRFDELPEVAKLPRVGGLLDPSVEAVIALHPDLVLEMPASANRAPVEKMAQLGLPVLALPLQNIAQTLAAMREVGRVLGVAAQAEEKVRAIEVARAELRQKSKTKSHPVVLFVYGFDPLVVAGPGSFAAELLDDVGAINAARDATTAYPLYSMESALRARPDVVINAADSQVGVEQVKRLPGLKEARWMRVPSQALLHPGPRLAEGLRELYALVHPQNSPAETPAAEQRH